MYSLAFLALCSFTMSLVLTPLLRNGAIRLGIVDVPGDPRKIHERPIPRIGGVAIATAYLAAFGLLFVLPLHAGRVLSSQLASAARILPAALLIFAVGLMDDLFALRPWHKLAGQFVAAAIAYFCGVQIGNPGGFHISHWLAFPITLFWLIGCANAFNLIDGMDGLASGVGLFATTTTLIAGLLHGNLPLAIAVAPLAGALLGFLRYNFNPASIFLGDSGSLFIGFMLGCVGVIWSQKSATLLGMTAPLIALSLPLLDTSLAIVRRFLRNQPIFGADRGHIHHRLLDRGITTRRAALTLYAVCGMAAALSLLMSVFDSGFGGLIIVLFCAAAWLGIQNLGYAEFDVAGKMISQRAVRQMIHAQLCLQSFEQRLMVAESPQEIWEVLQNASAEFGFRYVQMNLAGQVFGTRINPGPLDCGCPDFSTEQFDQPGACVHCWAIRIPLPQGYYVDFVRQFDSSGPHSVLVPFVDLVRRTLQLKLKKSEPDPVDQRDLLALASAASAGVARISAAHESRERTGPRS
jgi:UDP-GlcNAc:undecaprenyl-phosphate GlcNAc-1-phosphate transferase